MSGARREDVSFVGGGVLGQTRKKLSRSEALLRVGEGACWGDKYRVRSVEKCVGECVGVLR